MILNKFLEFLNIKLKDKNESVYRSVLSQLINGYNLNEIESQFKCLFEESQTINNIDDLYSGKEIVEDFNDEALIKFFQPPFEVNAEEIVKNIRSYCCIKHFFA